MRVFRPFFADVQVANARGVEHVRGPERLAYFGKRAGIGHAHRRHIVVAGNFHLRRTDAEQAVLGDKGFQFFVDWPAVDGRDAGDEDAGLFVLQEEIQQQIIELLIVKGFLFQ